MINKLKSIYFYLLYKVNKLKSAKIVCLEMVRLLCSEIWVFAFVGWRYVPSPPVLSRVNNNVMLIICHTVQHKIDFYLWNFKSTIRRMCLFMFWCWACHKTESTDLPFEYEHVCHGVGCRSMVVRDTSLVALVTWLWSNRPGSCVRSGNYRKCKTQLEDAPSSVVSKPVSKTIENV